MVVIVVPPFPQGDQGQKEAISALVAGLKPAPTKEMAGGIYQEGGVPQNGGADKKSPE